MTQEEQKRLISLVVQQVLERMNRDGAVDAHSPAPFRESPREVLLVFGPDSLLSSEIRARYRLMGPESYQGPECLEGVAGVCLTQLSRRDLVDLALGRDGSPATCAATCALLRGIPVFVLEQALEHRAFARRAVPAFYQLLEHYVQRIQELGVRLIAAPSPETGNGQVAVSRSRLIAEANALALLRQVPECPVRIPAGTIVTPSAQDVFRQAGREILREPSESTQEARS